MGDLKRVSWDQNECEREARAKKAAPTEPELIVHVPEASGVVLPVPVEFQLSILASEEDLREAGLFCLF